MKRVTRTLSLLLFCGPMLASAADTETPAARYEADKKVCAEASSSSARMQCLRDAKAEHDRAVADARMASTSQASASQAKAGTCADCGKVLSVVVGEQKGQGSAIGVIGGGVAGALLGRQVGGGTGRDLATIAGAAGGAYAGHKIEEKVNSTKVWTVRVRLNSGQERGFSFNHDPGLISGDAVKVSGKTLARL